MYSIVGVFDPVVATMLNSGSHNTKTNESSSTHSALVKPAIVQILKKCDD